MIPIEKVQDIIARHDKLEKELSSGNIDPKLFAKKSKDYSNLGNIISIAREYVKYEKEKKDLEQIVKDKNNFYWEKGPVVTPWVLQSEM